MITTRTEEVGAPDDTAADGPTTRTIGPVLIANAERFGLLFVFAIVIVVFSLLRPDTFATVANWRSIGESQSVLAVSALALMPALLCGRFDVSVGGNLCISCITCGTLISRFDVPTVFAILLGVMMGGLIGLFNGVMVAYFGVNSIIGTLAVSIILGGVVTAYTQGQPISDGLPAVFTGLGADLVFGIPTLVLLMIGLSLITWLLFTQTPFGRQVAALGSNITAARLSGMPVKRVMTLSFMAGGLLSGAAGVLIIGQLGSANPNVGSLANLLPALAAVFLGATTWKPGQYTVLGTLIALFFVGTSISGLALLGTRPWVTDVFNGSVTVIAIAISAQFRRKRTGAMAIGV